MVMNVKRLTFRCLVLLELLLSTSVGLASVRAEQPLLGLRSHADYESWRRVIPTHLKLQYAGGMGVGSVGVGWDYGRGNQWESDVMVGYLPKRYSDAAHLTLSLRQTYTPWNLPLWRDVSYEPLSCGVYLTTITGDKFWTREPGKYGGKYYKFASRVRLHVFVGQRINLSQLSRGRLQGASLYYEVSACDMNLISKFTNSSLKLTDMLFFSCGVRLQIARPR